MKHVVPALCVIAVVTALVATWSTQAEPIRPQDNPPPVPSPLAAAHAHCPIQISLAVPEQGALGKQLVVVITNTSQEPVNLWREWCSWGYFCVTLDAVNDAGHKVSIRKKPRGWSKNFPAPWTLRAGESTHRYVSLEGDPWLDGDQLLALPNEKWTLTAHYTISADDDSKKHKVWTGQATSIPHDYILR